MSGVVKRISISIDINQLICTSVDRVLNSGTKASIYMYIVKYCAKINPAENNYVTIFERRYATDEYQQTTLWSVIALNPPWFTKQQLKRKTRFSNHKSN